MRVNPQEFQAFPKQLVIGFVPASSGPKQIQQSLEGAGLADDQVDFLSGEEGLEILTRGGGSAGLLQRLIRRIERISQEGLHLGAAIDHLRAGNAMVAIRRVRAEDAPGIRSALESAGVGNHHYFGRLTFD
ncbi:MAG TPA: hypothetical protein VHI31_00670 [Actinomycetota bacterium]|nr:hypothetical protein [Actinomycetota bacterium]